MVKKLIISAFVLGSIAASFLFLVQPANAASIHDSPWCGLVFWRDGYCDDDDDNDAPAPAPAPVSSSNNAPVWVGGQTAFNINTGTLLQFSVSAYDPDNDTVTYAVSFLPTGATFNATTKTFAWTPANNQVGAYVVQFSAFDGKAYSYQSVSIGVNSSTNNSNTNTNTTNHKPVWSPLPGQNIKVNQTLQFAILATDADGDTVHYTMLNWPAGGTFNAATQTFTWNPNSNQIGTHVVSFRASDNIEYADMGVLVTVSPVTVAPSPTPTPTPNPTPAPVPVKLKIYDIKISVKDGDVIVGWETNLPAHSRVIYDTESQADLTKNFSYTNATPDGTVFETKHEINLGKLEIGRVYYLRAVSKTEKQMVISQEVIFVKLDDNRVNNLFGAFLLDILGPIFTNTAFLWLVILALVGFLFFLYRKIQKNNSPL